MITDPVTLPPDAPVSAALELMARYKISGVPIVDGGGKLVGILTNRDLRFVEDHDQPIENVMRKAAAGHRPARHHARARPRTSSGSTASRSCRSSTTHGALRGPHHGQGHQEADRVPERHPGRPGPPAGAARRSASGPTRSSGPRPSSRSASTCSSSTRPTATSVGVLDVVKAIKGGLDVEVIARQHRHRRGRRRPGRRRRRRRQGRRRSGLDLHHPGGGRRRRARSSPPSTTAPSPPAATASRSWPTAASSSRATSPRRSPPAPTS